jgi:hypothetical protein
MLYFRGVGKNLLNYDSLCVYTHFKGHTIGGFGGSLKNIAVGWRQGRWASGRSTARVGLKGALSGAHGRSGLHQLEYMKTLLHMGSDQYKFSSLKNTTQRSV